MRKYLPTILISSVMLIAELHRYFPDSADSVRNWIIGVHRPMTTAWNVKLLCDQVALICYAAAMLTWVNNRMNRTTAWAFLLWTVMDMAMYFYNYKTGLYGAVYFWYGIFWFAIYYTQELRSK